MIAASNLLKVIPNLPPHATETLQHLVDKMGDPEIHIPGLPSLPSIGEIAGPVKDAVLAVLGRFTIEFFQTAGVRISLNGTPLGGVGGKVTETLNGKAGTLPLKVVPILELGAQAGVG